MCYLCTIVIFSAKLDSKEEMCKMDLSNKVIKINMHSGPECIDIIVSPHMCCYPIVPMSTTIQR